MMQKFITPLPARVPLANIIDEPHYKFNVELRELRNENWQLEFRTWIPETGWQTKEWFFTTKELEKFLALIKISHYENYSISR